jgi:redox-sensitive bicupin YhaK (pirin superfamily)
MTAGRGISHSEMTPLLNSSAKNPMELFQIWLNLPRSKKLAKPELQMIWADQIQLLKMLDPQGRESQLTLIAGSFTDGLKEYQTLRPPMNSWGANPENDLAIWVIRLAPNARIVLPSASPLVNRTLYFFRGKSLKISSVEIESQQMIELQSDYQSELLNGSEESEILFLQARPIGEPVVFGGPFVMNSEEEVQQAYVDYRRTHFGGWPWPTDEVVFSRDEDRFVRHANGRIERRPLLQSSKN